jgi:hypothetical protein
MKQYSFWSIWRIPLLLILLITFGLLSALLGTGIWHWLSWIALLLPIVVLVRYIFFQASAAHS